MATRDYLKKILVFRTTVLKHQEVCILAPLLDGLMHDDDKWNFDLEDCDHILRVETRGLQPYVIIEKLAGAGYFCIELDDQIPKGALPENANFECRDAIPIASLYTP